MQLLLQFLPILLKLYCCFGHDLICMWLGCNLQIFMLLFSQAESFLGIIYNNVYGQGYLVGATLQQFYTDFFQNFTGVLVMV